MTDINLKSNGLWLTKNGKIICYNPWTHFEVNNPNGNVTMCCDHSFILGNINKNSIEEIWNGKKYQMIRKKMHSVGAIKMCGSNCLMLNGAKNYQSVAWYEKLDKDSKCYKNASLNEDEIRKGNIYLLSKPRWMRFAISFECNYRCYHCFQEDNRGQNEKLSKSNISELIRDLAFYQFLFIFGGEPTIHPEFPELLKMIKLFPHIRYCILSNGSVLHKFFPEIKEVNWGFIGISMDSATETNYKILRKSNRWEEVNQSIQALSGFREDKNFEFALTMTVNTLNYREIYAFVLLASKVNAIPKINLVSNHSRSFKFSLKYLSFDRKKRADILSQIENISKSHPCIFHETGLNVLHKEIVSYKNRQIETYFVVTAKNLFPAYILNILKNIKGFIHRYI